MRLNLAILAVAVALASPAVAAKQDKKPEDPNEVVCKREAVTGTRFVSRTCHTREEWNAIEEAAKRDASALANRPMINKSGD